MKNILIIVLLFFGNCLFSQEAQIVLDIKTENDATGRKLGGVTIEILQDGKNIFTKITSSKGKLALVTVPVGYLYWVKFKKDGYVTKIAQVDGRYDTPEDLEEESYQELNGSLFESTEGVDFSFMEKEPIIKFEFTPDGYQFTYDQPHFKNMQKNIADLKKKIEKDKQENEKKEIERKKREADYQTYVDAGDKAMDNSKYQMAIDQYSLALKLFDKPEVKTKLGNAQKMLKDEAASAQKETEYIAKMGEAKSAFNSNKYDDALKLYQEALKIKPNEKEPQTEISKIQSILSKQKEQLAEFNKLVSEGDVAVKSENFDSGIDKYTKALDLISSDSEVKSKLENARKLKKEKENAEKEKQQIEENFKALVASAKELVKNEDWENAKDKYNEALLVKPNEPSVLTEIKSIDKKLAELKAESDKLKETEQKYLAKMTEANTAFESNDLDKAIALYTEAKSIKPTEDEPQVKINKIVDAQKLKEKKEADFNKLVSQGDIALAGELFEDAIVAFEKAIKIKSSAVVDQKISEAKKLRSDKINAENLEKDREEKYQAAIKNANVLYDTEKWIEAKEKYKQALAIKNEESHPADRIKAIDTKLAELKAKNEEKEKLNEEYNSLITEANALFDSNELEKARSKYSAALQKKSGEKHPIDRIELINSTLTKQAAEKIIEDKYNAELNAANTLFDNKQYDQALTKYSLAAEIKPSEQEPKNQIKLINKILNDKKNSAQLEAEYKSLMEEGNALLNNGDLTTAMDRYKKALVVKENDAIALEKIKNVEELIQNDQEAKLKEKEFNDFVKKAETFFSAENYQEAKENYANALKIQNKAEVIEKIKVIDGLIAKNKEDSEKNKKFEDALKIADDLYTANNYQEALAQYEKVKLIKKTQHIDERINSIKKTLSAEKEKMENDNQFNDFVSKAKAFETDNKYEDAINNYKQALLLRSDEKITKKITELESAIISQQGKKEKELAYIDMVDKANVEFKNGNWSQAIDYYQKAKKFKEDETFPDDRIALAKDKMEAEVNLEKDKKYQALILKADSFYKGNSFDEAVEFYNKALAVKGDEAYPKNQLLAIEKKQKEKIAEATNKTNEENDYKKLVKEADNFFNADNFSESLIKYNEALSIKPTDFYVISQIKKVKLGLESDKIKQNKQKQYDELIADADQLMKVKNWTEAKIKYESALEIFNKTHPTNQIIICDEMMKKDSGSEAEKAYQKILTVAEKKMDAKDYKKAISLYERAISIRPSDSKPRAKIDEINQILANLKRDKEYNELIQKADNLFEKKEWKKAREFYVKAYAINNDSFADAQIKKIDELDNAYNKKQYDKMISKANEYFTDKNLTKAKGLYERAIKFLPNYDNTYPIGQVQIIKDILNPPLAIDNGTRTLGEKVVGMTEEEMDALLANDSEQRKFNEVNSVKTITKEMTSEEEGWSGLAQESTNLTKVKTDEIAIDQQIKGTIAEVERVKAEKATIEQRQIFDKEQQKNTIYTNQARFNQVSIIKNSKAEISENTINADIPRSEFETEVVKINDNLKSEAELQSAAQVVQSFDQKKYVTKIQNTHVTADPNKDVARKNSVDKSNKIQEQNKTIASEQSKDQVDASYDVKIYSNEVMDGIRIANFENDIPRQNTVDLVKKTEIETEVIEANLSKNQLETSFKTKIYTDKAVEEIRIENMINDVPRQKMEKMAVVTNNEVSTAQESFKSSQKVSTNATKDKISDEIDVQQQAFAAKDKERADDAENVIDIKEDIELSNKIAVNKNKGVSFDTKDYALLQTGITAQHKQKGSNTTVKNQDETVKAVKELNKNATEKAELNEKKVNGTVDYIINMKDINVDKIDVNVQNQLGKDFPEGVTEEIYQIKDSHGLLLSFVVRRVVVIGGEGNVYEKTKSRHGVTSYTKNGEPVSKQIWQENTANASLKSN